MTAVDDLVESERERGADGPVAPPTPTPMPDFDELYGTEWSGLLGLGWSLTGSWSTAEELVQDAFADAYRRWAEVGRLDRPGAWVRRAVINRAASHRRHRVVAARGLARWSSRDQSWHDAPSTDRTGDTASDVADPGFWAAVRALPERQAACVALHYLEDRSVADIAEILDIGAATVKVHLHRGRNNLAKTLAALTDDERRTTNPTVEEDR